MPISYANTYVDTGHVDRTNELTTKVDNLEKHVRYLSEHLDKLIDDKEKEKSKKEIFMVFYLNVDRLTRQQSEQYVQQISDAYSKNVSRYYDINSVVIPVKEQPTKVEIVNPSLVNGDIIKNFKNLVDTLDDNKYRELIDNL